MNRTLLAAVTAVLLIGPSQAHQIKTKTLTIMHPWVHAAATGSASTDGFVVIKNIGKETDRLLGAFLDGAGEAAIVQQAPGTPGGVCKLAKGLEVPAGAAVELKPGNVSLQFGKLGKTLIQDLYADGVLHFEKAGAVKIEFYIEAAGATASSDALVVADCASPAMSQ